MDADEKRARLAEIAREIARCTDCALCRNATKPVPGEGNPDARIVFIGEGPGFYEDQQGRPFVGASGKFLDELLRGIGLDRKSVFITNVVKHRPPQNRDPEPSEIDACRKYLDAQLETIAPKIVVTLGRHSMQRYFPGESISRIHGQPRRKGDLVVVPMYHPAAALHQASLRAVIEADFRRLPDFLAKILAGESPVGAAATDAPPPHMRKQPAPMLALEPATAAAASATEPDPRQMRLL